MSSFLPWPTAKPGHLYRQSKRPRASILKGISFEVQEGEIVSLIGSNGAGKSTVLMAISALVAPTSGEILFNNQKIVGVSSHKIIKQGIRLVPEGKDLFPHISVLENLNLGAYL